MKHSVEECVKSLSQVCSVNAEKKTLSATKGSLGLKRLGKVDYLVNHCGWSFRWVTPKDDKSKK